MKMINGKEGLEDNGLGLEDWSSFVIAINSVINFVLFFVVETFQLSME